MAAPSYSKVVALEEFRAATKEFMQLIDGICRREGWREGEAFTHFLYAALSATSSPIFKDRDPARFEKSEARYADVLRQCRHPAETMSDLSKMLGVLVEALEIAPRDFLGPIFCEIASSDRAGQFFTPYHLSRAMAEMTLRDAKGMLAANERRGQSFIALQEPACGSGGMCLAANEVLRAEGIFIERRAHWVCIDIDPRCCAMAFLQLNLTGASADIVHGNALSVEVWDEWPTLMAVMFPKRWAPQRPDLDLGPPQERAERRARWIPGGDARG
jgi:hypothetical protein